MAYGVGFTHTWRHRTSVSVAAMAYYRGLGACEEVRGFLPAVVVGVQDRHVPVDLRIVEPGATMAILEVVFNDDLTVGISSEIKDEICSKLESAVQALKSRISRICGINELERRTRRTRI